MVVVLKKNDVKKASETVLLRQDTLKTYTIYIDIYSSFSFISLVYYTFVKNLYLYAYKFIIIAKLEFFFTKIIITKTNLLITRSTFNYFNKDSKKLCF